MQGGMYPAQVGDGGGYPTGGGGRGMPPQQPWRQMGGPVRWGGWSSPMDAWRSGPGDSWKPRAFHGYAALLLLFGISMVVMSIWEFFMPDYDHLLSLATWWWLSLADMIASALEAIISMVLAAQEKDERNKQTQEYPAPTQDPRVYTIGTVGVGLRFVFVAILNVAVAPTAIYYVNTLKAALALGLIGESFMLRDVFMSIRMPVSLPEKPVLPS